MEYIIFDVTENGAPRIVSLEIDDFPDGASAQSVVMDHLMSCSLPIELLKKTSAVIPDADVDTCVVQYHAIDGKQPSLDSLRGIYLIKDGTLVLLKSKQGPSSALRSIAKSVLHEVKKQ